MAPTQTENKQQAANRQHARENNSQRIRFTLSSKLVDGTRRYTLCPTTLRDQPRVLPGNTPYLAQRR